MILNKNIFKKNHLEEDVNIIQILKQRRTI
jgi:hypothetical protein